MIIGNDERADPAIANPLGISFKPIIEKTNPTTEKIHTIPNVFDIAQIGISITLNKPKIKPIFPGFLFFVGLGYR